MHALVHACRRPEEHDLESLKAGLPIPELWRHLGLPGQPRESCRSPFRPDRHASFSIYEQGRRWWDHGTGQGGDVIDFLAQACHLDKPEATRRFLSLVGVAEQPAPSQQRPRAASHSQAAGRSLHLPPLHRGTGAELAAVARSRHLSVEAVALAQSLRTLAFGPVCGHACWILGDDSGHVAEARRVQAQPFPAVGTLGERKAHTLRGSHKSWPCGAAVLQRCPGYRCVMLVEGGPDYLAALHLLLVQQRWDVLPVAMLGRGTGTHIHPHALALLAGRRVRLYPHADADGGGVRAAQHWAQQLSQHGCVCDLYDFSGLRQVDDRPVNDLNDLLRLHPDHYAVLPGLLPPAE